MSRDGRKPPARASAPEWPGGEMGDRVSAMDWSATPLGPADAWPECLKTAVRIMLGSRYPMFVWWGPELVNLYNDAYIPVLGARHPDALGASARGIWSEIWDVVGPQAETVLRDGQATWNESLLLLMQRHGFAEETYFTFSYSPAPDDRGGIGGLFCACTEDTERVLGARRLKTLRDLAELEAGALRSDGGVCAATTAVLARAASDVPFAAIFLVEPDGAHARAHGACGVEVGSSAAPVRVAIGGEDDVWDFAHALEARRSLVVEGLSERFGPLPAGPWSDMTAERALVLPLGGAGGQERPIGFLVTGLSPCLVFDAGYRSFLELAAGQLAMALANARAYTQERARAEALAELDRAKTQFFGNVSHEFRTPLTLMLGPLADLLERDGLTGGSRETLSVVDRNARRLLKLVNSLLDFSRIEAGRMAASREPLDLAVVTADLASNFRSACEDAGLALEVDCAPLPEPVWVDRDLWEKIVLNLLSNAFKYTFEGSIGVSLRAEGDRAVLRVRDTGVGIPEREIPRLFERFHRIEGVRGRTHEGTGIGLALVQELVALHGGRVDVESEEGRGSTFTVAVPRGAQPVVAAPPAPDVSPPEARPDPTGAGAPSIAAVHVDELTRGEASDGLAFAAPPPGNAPRARILIADDNADMRDYLRRLLSPRYEVEAVADGEAALERALCEPPDLVIADVMMPGLDGFELLEALRDDDPTFRIPVLMLSARAGEKARIEGLEAGADDYLVKPFSARELFARVEAQLELARVRGESERRFREFADSAPAMLWVTDEAHRCTFLSRGWTESTGQPESEGLGLGWLEMVHPDDRARTSQVFLDASARNEPFEVDYRLRGVDGSYRWMVDLGRPRTDAQGKVIGYIGSVVDVHERRRAEDALKAADRRKDEFLAVLAHELRNPLSGLQNGLSLLEVEDDLAARTDTRRMMQRQIRRLVRLIEDLLDVNRIGRGALELRQAPVDLAAILREALEGCDPRLTAGRSVELDLPAGTLPLRGDAVRLTQVFGNLLDNACKFTQPGGRVRVSVARDGDEVLVLVQDDGVGIAPENLASVFDLFENAEPGSVRARGDAGIGLSLTRQLVELHGGTVQACSEGLGRGSTFAVRLPAPRAPAPRGGEATRAAAAAPAEPARVARLRILAADDHPEAVEGLAKLLRMDGHDVRTAGDGAEALALAGTFRPDVALLDIGMPELDGYEVARRIRAEPWGKDLVLVAVTGWGQDSDRRRTSEAGFDRHLVKPLMPDDLKRTLAELRPASGAGERA